MILFADVNNTSPYIRTITGYYDLSGYTRIVSVLGLYCKFRIKAGVHSRNVTGLVCGSIFLDDGVESITGKG